MFCRIFTLALILGILPKTLVGQSVPSLSKTPTISDKTLSGTGQGKTADYDSVVLYVCSSRTQPVAPLDCSGEDGAGSRKVKLVNLGGTPFPITGSDLTGKICTRWNERESTWRKSGTCRSRGTSQSKS